MGDARAIFELLPRQREVAELVADGLCDKEIASRRDTTWGTIRNQMRKIMQRVGVPDRTALAMLVLGARCEEARRRRFGLANRTGEFK